MFLKILPIDSYLDKFSVRNEPNAPENVAWFISYLDIQSNLQDKGTSLNLEFRTLYCFPVNAIIYLVNAII